MQFCPKCESLLKYSTDDSQQLMLYCMQCGHEDKSDQARCIYVNKLVAEVRDIEVNPDFCHDRSLPHTAKIVCPNPGCASREQEELRDVIKFAVNREKRLGYLCCVCHAYWK